MKPGRRAHAGARGRGRSRRFILTVVVGLFAVALGARGVATVLADVPQQRADLTTVSGQLTYVGCGYSRYRCGLYSELELAGQATPYRMSNHGSLNTDDLEERLAVGRGVTLLVRHAGERDYLRPDLDGWRDWDVWEIEQDGRRVVAYDAVAGAARDFASRSGVVAALGGVIGLIAGLVLLTWRWRADPVG